MDELELLELFAAYGTIGTVTIIRDQETNVSAGYGFITMTDQAGADRAIAALDGATIDERTLSVRIADNKNPPPVKPAPRANKTYNKPKFTKAGYTKPGSYSNSDASGEKKKRPRKRL
ncbi:hypothetical protein GCM10023149_54240 [Mucilaginibacter gynuensis]|uniref:RRM domain-containing protein n=2 Tax=Mucilaginibacter gynuensis TaxID=1302236 RepID=A0ABP8HNU9_9SPHI